MKSSTSSDVLRTPSTGGERLEAGMPRFGAARWTRRALHLGWAAVGLLVAHGCDRPKPASPTDSTVVTSPNDSATPTPPALVASGWNVDAGPMVILPTVDGGLVAGSLLRPEATELTVGDTAGLGAAIGAGRVELFSRTGRVGTARLVVGAAPAVDSGCTAWPVARLSPDGGGVVPQWTAAFLADRITALPLDSIEGLPPRDSARFAIDLTRLASSVPNDTSNTFRGLPFVVLRAWRTRGLDSGFVVATLARRINQEDSPQEERLVLVIDQHGDDSKKWTVAWHERAAGREEELVVAEPLLAFRTKHPTEVHLLFGRDDGVALGAAVLTRDRSGWHLQWESAVAGCD